MTSKRKASTKRATAKAPGRATKAARKATGARQAGKAKPGASPARTAAAKADKGTARIGRSGTKQAKLIAMLRGAAGATIAEIVAATGWQPHTVRGAISGALKKKLNLTIVSEKTEKRGRVYPPWMKPHSGTSAVPSGDSYWQAPGRTRFWSCASGRRVQIQIVQWQYGYVWPNILVSDLCTETAESGGSEKRREKRERRGSWWRDRVRRFVGEWRRTGRNGPLSDAAENILQG